MLSCVQCMLPGDVFMCHVLLPRGAFVEALVMYKCFPAVMH